MKTKTLLFSLLSSLAVCGGIKAVPSYDRINVTDIPGSSLYAVPNDGNSDTAAINAAINVSYPSPSPGYTPTKSIYFPSGTYIFDGSSPMTLPSNKSIRLYGDGPGVSTIIFTGSNPGITAALGNQTLQIEGLTLQTNSADLGTAISATFTRTGDLKFRTATIRNVEIQGSSQVVGPSGYWRHGIDLSGASNALIEDVQIHGSWSAGYPSATDAIHYHAPIQSGSAATQLFISNLHVSYYKTAIRTSGHVEGFYMSGFELVFCGTPTTGIMEITGATSSNNDATPVFQMMNGHINQLAQGVRFSNLLNVKVADVMFFNLIGTGTHLDATNCADVTVTGCTFIDFNCISGCSPVTGGQAIYLDGTGGAKISTNHFGLNSTSDGAVVVTKTCSRVMIVDNDFGTMAAPIANDATDTHIRLITFP